MIIFYEMAEKIVNAPLEVKLFGIAVFIVMMIWFKLIGVFDLF